MCFVCGVVLKVNVETLNGRSKKKSAGAALLENNLDITFLLRKMLQVPCIQLECQLMESGDNPESWISLCDHCTKLIKNARELDEKIRGIREEFRLIQLNVIRKISAGSCEATTEDHDNYQRNSDFERTIRSFVKECKLKC